MITPNLYSFVEGKMAAEALNRALLQADINNLRAQQALRADRINTDLLGAQASDLFNTRSQYNALTAQGQSPYQALSQVAPSFFAAPYAASAYNSLLGAYGQGLSYNPVLNTNGLFGQQLDTAGFNYGQVQATPAAQLTAEMAAQQQAVAYQQQAQQLAQQRALADSLIKQAQQPVQIVQPPQPRPVIAPPLPPVPTVTQQPVQRTQPVAPMFDLNKLPSSLNIGTQKKSLPSQSSVQQQPLAIGAVDLSSLAPTNYSASTPRSSSVLPSYYLVG